MSTNLSGQRKISIAPSTKAKMAYYHPPSNTIKEKLEQWLPAWLEYLQSLVLKPTDVDLCRQYRIGEIQLRKLRGQAVAFVNAQEALRIYQLGYKLVLKHVPSRDMRSWLEYNMEGMELAITAPIPTPRHKDFELELWSEESMAWMGAILNSVRPNLNQVEGDIELDVDADVEMEDASEGSDHMSM